MTNELTRVELFGENRDGDQMSYTCASGTAIPLGTLLQLTDPRTASAASGLMQPCAGVAAAQKSGTDFSTKISVYTNGIFEALASGAIPIGSPVQIASNTEHPNSVMKAAAATASGAALIGIALEAADDAETINIKLRL